MTAATPSRKYPWMFSPHSIELIDLNLNYNSQVIEARSRNSLETIRLLLEKRRLEKNTAAGSVVSSTDWYYFDRRNEALNIEIGKTQRTEMRLRDRIEFEAPKVSGLFLSEILVDYAAGELTPEQFKSYLETCQRIIETGNDLKAYNTPAFEKIKEQITIHLKPKASENEQAVSKEAPGERKKRAGQRSK